MRQPNIITDRYHYIRWYDPALKPEATADHGKVGTGMRSHERLFDVRTDGLECVDISERAEYRHVLEEMRRRLDTWMQETNDWLLTGDTPKKPCKDGWGENWPINPERTPWEGVPPVTPVASA